MGKSIKLKNNIFIDSSSVDYKRTNLESKIEELEQLLSTTRGSCSTLAQATSGDIQTTSSWSQLSSQTINISKNNATILIIGFTSYLTINANNAYLASRLDNANQKQIISVYYPNPNGIAGATLYTNVSKGQHTINFGFGAENSRTAKITKWHTYGFVAIEL